MVNQKILEEFVSEIKPEAKENNKTYSAIVSKIDKEGTVWVRVAGSDKDTPTALVGTEVKKGDAVNVEWRNNKLYIASNYSNPAAGVGRVGAVEQAAALANEAANNAITDAGRAKEAADSASASADQAQKDAGAAKESAENAGEYAARALGNLSTVQSVTETLNWITAHGTMTLTTDTALDPTHVYFVRDNDGDYEVGNYHYSIVTEPKLEDISTYYVLSIDESLNNYVGTHLAVTSEGLWILPEGLSANSYKILIATGGQGHTYEDAGTYIIDSAGKIVAKLGEVITLGVNDNLESFMQLDYHSTQLIDKEDNPYFYISDLRDKDDNWQATIEEVYYGDGQTTTFTVQLPVSSEISATDSSRPSNTATRNGQLYVFAYAPSNAATVTIRYKTTDSLAKAYTLGLRGTGIIGAMSLAEGYRVIAPGAFSHAEGSNTRANGVCSHSEGAGTKADGDYSHAEGYSAYAKGNYSHSEGYDTNAFGEASHAEGKGTEASSMGAHAEGYNTTASGYDCSHAEGDSTIASGGRSHAEGGYTIASGGFSHAEGRGTVASGSISHAEGAFTTAMGDYSHSEGRGTEVRGAYSHTEGYNTIASGIYSHVQGMYNIEDPTAYKKTTDTSINSGKTYYTLSDGKFYEVSSPTTSELSNYYEYTPGNAEQAFILGNGTSNANRSNALTVDWLGEVQLYLDVDSSASKTTPATSGEDKDLFNAIRDLGWYDDVIS